jgi:uncharacterized protein involved in tolerance to divalent cations
MNKFSLDDLHHRICKKHYEKCCEQLFKTDELICWASKEVHQDEKRCIICTQEKTEKLERNLTYLISAIKKSKIEGILEKYDKWRKHHEL